ncbi:hypothetical protein RFI_00593 [Reticulomyxa filosa]|uniref:Uncharacterized protein n=1 Tax=Reticulomyxa filosa TaxID=46433 RepID=X6PEK7_RETFI|nr:hypothetical protein RFI_00593 [Reticulomyxa filosa]|eukprot:ETO36469.1 hypothetical protein RFI_00593 [Reticulomyxa filosa]
MRHSELSVNQSNEPKEHLEMKIRKEFCKNYPILVIDPINGYQLKSQTSILKIFGRKTQQLENFVTISMKYNKKKNKKTMG